MSNSLHIRPVESLKRKTLPVLNKEVKKVKWSGLIRGEGSSEIASSIFYGKTITVAGRDQVAEQYLGIKGVEKCRESLNRVNVKRAVQNEGRNS